MERERRRMSLRFSFSGISCLQPLCPESLFNPLSQNPSPSSLSSKHTFRNPLPKSPSPESQPAAPVMAMPHLQSTVCPFLSLLPSPPRSGSAPSPEASAGSPRRLPEYFTPMKPYALQTQFLGVTEGKPADIIMRNTNCGMIKGSRHCRERPWAEGAGSCCLSRSARRSCRLPDDAAGSARVFKGAAPRRGSRRRASPREITPRKQTVRRMTWFHQDRSI